MGLQESKTVVFIGPQYSGKDYHLKLIISKCDDGRIFKVSASGKLSAYVDSGGKHADEVRRRMAAGELISGTPELDRLMMALLSEALAETWVKAMTARGLLALNGYPRNMDQVDHLINSLVRLYGCRLEDLHKFLKLVHLNISEEVALARLEADTKADRGQREDDNPETLRKRLGIFRKETIPAIRHLRNEGLCAYIEIDGDRPVEVVNAEIVDKLGLRHWVKPESESISA